jgi:hypothetical protein
MSFVFGRKVGLSFVGVAALTLGFAGLSCSSEEDDGGGKPGTGGSTGGGGSGGSTGGTGASGGSGGSGGGGDAGDPYTCDARPDPDPGGTATAGQACCGELGTCTPSGDVDEAQRAALGLEDCSPTGGLLCAPNLGDAGADAGARVSCESTGGIEGRCIPDCFLLGRPESANLPTTGCGTDERCAPCFSPLDGEPTGACSLNGDAPVDPAPTPFADCGAPDGGGAALGVCVPEASAASIATLPQLTCPDTFVCAPRNKVENPNFCFEKCTFTLLNAPGACVAAFVVAENPAASVLMQETCAAGEVCAPCLDPQAMPPVPTGACE